MMPMQQNGAMAALRRMAQRMGPGGAPINANPMNGAAALAPAAGGGAALAAMDAMKAANPQGGALPPGGGGAPPMAAPPMPQPQPGQMPPPASPASDAGAGDDTVSRAARLLREAQLVGDASVETLAALAEELFSWLPPQQREALVMTAAQLGQTQGVMGGARGPQGG